MNVGELTLEQKEVVMHAYTSAACLTEAIGRPMNSWFLQSRSYCCSVSWRTELPVGFSSKDKADGASSSATVRPR